MLGVEPGLSAYKTFISPLSNNFMLGFTSSSVQGTSLGLRYPVCKATPYLLYPVFILWPLVLASESSCGSHSKAITSSPYIFHQAVNNSSIVFMY